MGASDRPDQRASGRDPAREALRRLEERLDRASDAAERLLSEASAYAAKPPPSGWQARPGDSTERTGNEAELLLGLLQALRELVPPDLQRRVVDALREVLLALRALIDWYLERMDQRAAEPADVEDIPIT